MVKVISESVPWLRPSTPGADLFTFTAAERSDPNRLHPTPPSQKTASPKRLIVSKDSKVYSARGTTIRRADLQHLKALDGSLQDSYIKAVKTFELPGLGFEIKQLEISEDGAWLAVVGETRVGVVLLPSTQLEQKDLDRVRPK
jgi:nucleoporin NUP82